MPLSGGGVHPIAYDAPTDPLKVAVAREPSNEREYAAGRGEPQHVAKRRHRGERLVVLPVVLQQPQVLPVVVCRHYSRRRMNVR